jgi:hypothetical protein
MHPSALRKDGRPFGTTRVLIEPGFDLHPDYALDQTLRRITATGRLDVLAVYLKAARLLKFTARWDERAGLLDIDPPDGWPRSRQSRYLRGLDGYGTHHPALLPDRRFEVHVQIPGGTLFRGVVSFGFSREFHLGGATFSLAGGNATFTVGRAADLPTWNPVSPLSR